MVWLHWDWDWDWDCQWFGRIGGEMGERREKSLAVNSQQLTINKQIQIAF